MNNVVITLAPLFFIESSSFLQATRTSLFLIESSSFLQATRTSIRSRMILKFGRIRLGTYELPALERLKKSP